jgi:hypothetical protein
MDAVYDLIAVGMLVYWGLWMIGFKVPGTGSERYRGWRYSAPAPVITNTPSGRLYSPEPHEGIGVRRATDESHDRVKVGGRRSHGALRTGN